MKPEQSHIERLREYAPLFVEEAAANIRAAADRLEQLERQLAAPLSAENDEPLACLRLGGIFHGTDGDELDDNDIEMHTKAVEALQERMVQAGHADGVSVYLYARAAQRAAPTAQPNNELIAAAQAVVDRWDSPKWKDQAHTGEFIDRLRKALAAPQEAPLDTSLASTGKSSLDRGSVPRTASQDI